ncbi:MAG: HesA/MoeB/ThiF family protein [Halothiobacillaceae bacterium]
MNDEQLLRYSRQIMLPEVDVVGQERLLGATALVVGLGGLGSPVALYLAAAGVGRLILADHDTVDLSNLQRQIAHGVTDLSRPKVDSAADAVARIDPTIETMTLAERMEGAALEAAVRQADIALDCSDNFALRFALNAACRQYDKPLVSGAAIRFEGQVAVYDPARADSPCYRCLYRDEGAEDRSCVRNGVLSPVVGVIGSLQAVEAVKVLLDVGAPLVGRLLLYDALAADIRILRLRRDPECPVCGSR